jgi:hypothetical protein
MDSIQNTGHAQTGTFRTESERKDAQANQFKNLSDISKDQLDEYFQDVDMPKKGNKSQTDLSGIAELGKDKSEEGNTSPFRGINIG